MAAPKAALFKGYLAGGHTSARWFTKDKELNWRLVIEGGPESLEVVQNLDRLAIDERGQEHGLKILIERESNAVVKKKDSPAEPDAPAEAEGPVS